MNTVTVPADQWERIAAVVRAARSQDNTYYLLNIAVALDALTPDDIEAVQWSVTGSLAGRAPRAVP